MKPPQPSRAHLWLFVPFLLMLSAFCLAPTYWVLVNSFVEEEGGFGFANYERILSSRFYLIALENSFWLSLYSSVLGLLIGFLATSSLRFVQGNVRHFVISFVNMSNNFAGVPLAFAFIIILGTNGAITLMLNKLGFLDNFDLYTRAGLTVVYTYFQIPLAILLLYPAFDALKEDWEEAAKLLGASTFTYWRKVVLPIMLPSLLGSFVLLLANALGAYATAFALTASNVNLVPIRIGALVAGDISLNPNLAAALSIVLVAQLLLVTVINQWLMRRRRYVSA
ncbi:MAG: ABC transporter permease subunit [Alcaligenaceae bacterium]|nr:ABC transporter permease subunit [Alcaligenaceae bacterium]